MLRWSIQRANGQYRDHLVGQLTTPKVVTGCLQQGGWAACAPKRQLWDICVPVCNIFLGRWPYSGPTFTWDDAAEGHWFPGRPNNLTVQFMFLEANFSLTNISTFWQAGQPFSMWQRCAQLPRLSCVAAIWSIPPPPFYSRVTQKFYFQLFISFYMSSLYVPCATRAYFLRFHSALGHNKHSDHY